MRDAKENREKNGRVKTWGREARVLLAPRFSRGHFLCHARRTKRITHDGLSERGTSRSLALTLCEHACKTVCDVKSGIDPCPSLARS